MYVKKAVVTDNGVASGAGLEGLGKDH